METKFNFKSQVCTSIDQSRRLLELGLKKETADMCHTPFRTKADGEPLEYTEHYSLPWGNDIPAWSLHRLLMMTTSKRKVMLIRCESDLFDVIIKRIEHEIKEGYFNKEYLEG